METQKHYNSDTQPANDIIALTPTGANTQIVHINYHKNLQRLPFGLVPHTYIAGDIVHRTLIEMMLPQHKTFYSGEHTSGWVLGNTNISSDTTPRASCWYYRDFGKIRKTQKKFRTVQVVRVFFMRLDTGSGHRIVLTQDEVQRIIGRFDWETLQFFLLWCAGVYQNNYTNWEIPQWIMRHIFRSKKKPERLEHMHYLFNVLRHCYIQCDNGEPFPCWSISHTVEKARDFARSSLSTKRKASIVGLQRKHMGLQGSWCGECEAPLLQAIQAKKRLHYGKIPFYVLTTWNQDQDIGRYIFYIYFNKHIGGKYRVSTILEAILGPDRYNYIVSDAKRLNRFLQRLVNAENIIRTHGVSIHVGIGDHIHAHGHSQKILNMTVHYTIHSGRTLRKEGKTLEYWYSGRSDLFQRTRYTI